METPARFVSSSARKTDRPSVSRRRPGMSSRPERSARDAVRVVHRDRELLVLEKPAGLPTTSPDDGPSLVALAHELDPSAPRLHPTSRLDSDVTGLVTFARTARATRALTEARASGRYARCYVALVAGVVAEAGGTWTDAIGLDPRDARRRVAVAEGARGARVQVAATAWERRSSAGGVSAIHARPRTGRTHQIRVHAAHAGLPIFGDTAYGGPSRVVLADGRVVTARRVLLHCARLRLPDVERGGDAVLELESPLPEDLVKVWGALGGDVTVIRPERA